MPVAVVTSLILLPEDQAGNELTVIAEGHQWLAN